VNRKKKKKKKAKKEKALKKDGVDTGAKKGAHFHKVVSQSMHEPGDHDIDKGDQEVLEGINKELGEIGGSLATINPALAGMMDHTQPPNVFNQFQPPPVHYGTNVNINASSSNFNGNQQMRSIHPMNIQAPPPRGPGNANVNVSVHINHNVEVIPNIDDSDSDSEENEDNLPLPVLPAQGNRTRDESDHSSSSSSDDDNNYHPQKDLISNGGMTTEGPIDVNPNRILDVEVEENDGVIPAPNDTLYDIDANFPQPPMALKMKPSVPANVDANADRGGAVAMAEYDHGHNVLLEQDDSPLLQQSGNGRANAKKSIDVEFMDEAGNIDVDKIKHHRQSTKGALSEQDNEIFASSMKQNVILQQNVMDDIFQDMDKSAHGDEKLDEVDEDDYDEDDDMAVMANLDLPEKISEVHHSEASFEQESDNKSDDQDEMEIFDDHMESYMVTKQ